MAVMASVYDTRQTIKVLHEKYRAAARRLNPDATVNTLVSVNEVERGAFIEIIVFVPRSEAEKETV